MAWSKTVRVCLPEDRFSGWSLYGFTVEEVDFIINYSMKSRMGRDENEVEA